MAEWKREIRKLCKDFCIPTEIYAKIIRQTENNKREIPYFYKGNQDEYNYDTAYAHIKPYILGL